MADSKVSGLVEATELDGDDLLYSVVDGVSAKVRVDSLASSLVKQKDFVESSVPRYGEILYAGEGIVPGFMDTGDEVSGRRILKRFDLAWYYEGGEEGSLAHPSPVGSLFQDSAGTIPVTAYGDPIGLAQDQSGNGNDAAQTTFPARPLWGRMPRGGVRNELDSTSDLSGAAWSRQNITLGSPEANGAVKLVVDAGVTSGVTRLYQRLPSRSGVHTVQISAKAGELRYLNLAAHAGNSSNYSIASFDLVDGVIIGSRVSGGNYSYPATPAAIKPDPGNEGYYICSVGVVIGSTAVPPSISIVGDSSPQTEPTYDNSFLQYSADGTSGIYVMKPQLEFADGATDYQQRIASWDVTEQGVPDTPIIYFDTVDDALSQTLPAGTYTVAVAGDKGIYFDTVEHAGGTWTYGPTTWTGGPTDAIDTLIGQRLIGALVIDRALTEAEKTDVVAYWMDRGAPGVWELGPELWVDPSLGNGAWADNGDGSWTATNAPTGDLTVPDMALLGELYVYSYSLSTSAPIIVYELVTGGANRGNIEVRRVRRPTLSSLSFRANSDAVATVSNASVRKLELVT